MTSFNIVENYKKNTRNDVASEGKPTNVWDHETLMTTA